MSRQIKDIKDFNTGQLVYPRTHISAVVGLENFSGGGSSEANVKAVDTGDVVDDVTVNYATQEYVDSVLGDINSILESIISGGKNMITFYFRSSLIPSDKIELNAEDGMTWEEWINSEYNTEGFYTEGNNVYYQYSTYIVEEFTNGYSEYITKTDLIKPDHMYQVSTDTNPT